MKHRMKGLDTLDSPVEPRGGGEMSMALEAQENHSLGNLGSTELEDKQVAQNWLKGMSKGFFPICAESSDAFKLWRQSNKGGSKKQVANVFWQ